jgi:hypothetical protein
MFKRILGKTEPSSGRAQQIEAVCPHTVLIPSWDKPEDMGHEERATRFTCESCRIEFTLVEALALRRAEAGRLARQLLGGTEQTSTN